MRHRVPGTVIVLVLASVCSSGLAQGGELAKLRWVLGTPVLDPLVAHTSLAQYHGWFREEGIEVEMTALGGGAKTTALVAAGNAELGFVAAEEGLLNAARGVDLGVVYIYNQNRAPIFHWAFLPESPVTDLRQLREKRIGVNDLASSSVHYAKGELRSLGLDPDRDVTFVAVGIDQQAYAALKGGHIDALVGIDTSLARLQTAGLSLRVWKDTPYSRDYFSGGLTTRRELLKARRRDLVGFFRGMNKGIVFALENPTATVKIHWKMYPESKPKGFAEDVALRNTLHVLAARAYKWSREGRRVPKFGAFAKEEWELIARALGVQDKVDVTKLYTNELIDDAGAFDEAKVRAFARAFNFEEVERTRR